MSDISREQKLEKAFMQFIEVVAKMRSRQTKFDNEFGKENRQAKHRSQEKVDAILKEMGITDNMDFKECSILFVNKNL